MRHRRLVIQRAALLFLLLFELPVPGFPAEEDQDVGPPLVSSGTAALDLRGRQLSAPFDVTAVGPLFPLQPIVAHLGGQLEIGPLEQMHALTLGEETALFGPGVMTLTLGQEISTLSQPPRVGLGGLHVPLDLLTSLYGEIAGYAISWDPETTTLTIDRAGAREIAVRPDIVHQQGVTTIVLLFSEKPRFRVNDGAEQLRVEILNDRLRPVASSDPPGGALIGGIDFSDREIVIGKNPGTVAQSYELENPYRLVFDVYRGATQAGESRPVAPRPPPRVRDLPGIHTIVIDPGHGGENTGAISRNGVQEKEITLQIALMLQEALERVMPVRVIMTRRGDDELELDARSAIANQNKADLFISLHVNSSYGRTAHGAETFFLSLQASDEMAAEIAAIENQSNSDGEQDPLNDLDLILWDLAQTHHLSESQRFARLIQEELNGALGLADRGVKQAPFRVLRGAAMPAVLVELGFLSNGEEERKLQDPVYRNELVDALVRATQRYKALTGG